MQELRLNIKFFSIAILLASNLSFVGDALFKFHFQDSRSETSEVIEINHVEERLEDSCVENVEERESEENVFVPISNSYSFIIFTTCSTIKYTYISKQYLEIVAPPPEHFI